MRPLLPALEAWKARAGDRAGFRLDLRLRSGDGYSWFKVKVWGNRHDDSRLPNPVIVFKHEHDDGAEAVRRAIFDFDDARAYYGRNPKS